MASLIVRFNYSVIDGKNKGAEITYHILADDAYTLNSLDGAARALIPILRNLMKGGIKGGSISTDIDTSALYVSFPSLPIPDPDSDVEEGGLFTFRDVEGIPFRNRIPTFDEDLIISGTRQIDIMDSRVVAYINIILNGVAVGPDEYFVVNGRGVLILDSKDEREYFKKRHYKRRKR